MGLRLLASFPVAALMIALLFVSASSYVSAIETSFESNETPPIRIERAESECEVMNREIRTLSLAATTCDLDLQCLGSPILCPITLSANQERAYWRLRAEIAERCDAFDFLAAESGQHFRVDLARCGAGSIAGQSIEANRSTEPSTFIF